MNGKHYIGNRASSLELYDKLGPITGVALIIDDEHELFAGDRSGYVLSAECPYATEQMAADAFAKVSGKTYQGYRSTDVALSADAELGDGITVGGVYSMLAYRRVNFGPGHMSEISAPGDNEVDHEYPYISSTKRETERKIAETRSQIAKTAEEIRLEVFGEDGYTGTALKVMLDGVVVTTTNDDGTKTITLKDGVVTAASISANAVTSDKIAANVSIESPSLILRVPLDDDTTATAPALHVVPKGQESPFGSIYYSYKASPGEYESAHNLWITTREWGGATSTEPYGSIKIRSGYRMSLEAKSGIYMNGGTLGIVYDGNVDFSGATVTGLSGVTAVFG